jgi:hypothetical protein
LKDYQHSLVRALLIVTCFIFTIILLTWANIKYSEQNPGGNDFLVHWVGTRAFMEEGISPYSDETARRIQTIAYGRPALEGEHELRVAYPLYSTLIFAPFALIKDYTIARALWMTLLEISIGLLIFMSIQITRWRPSLLVLLLFFVFGFTWYHSFRPLILGNSVVLVSLAVVGALLAIQYDKDELAGFLLGLSSIKPQVVVLLIAFVIIWGISKRRWLLVGWTIGTVVVLSAAAAIFIPDWIVQNLREVIRYPSYNPPGTLSAVFAYWWPAVGHRIGLGISLVLLVFLVLEWLGSIGKDYRHFLWTACMTLAFSQWIGIQTDPGNFVVLFLPLTIVFSAWYTRWGKSGSSLVVLSVLILFIGIWALFLQTVKYSDQPVQHPIMFFPLPAFVIMGLYWVRWWAVRPVDLWIDMMRQREQV